MKRKIPIGGSDFRKNWVDTREMASNIEAAELEQEATLSSCTPPTNPEAEVPHHTLPVPVLACPTCPGMPAPHRCWRSPASRRSGSSPWPSEARVPGRGSWRGPAGSSSGRPHCSRALGPLHHWSHSWTWASSPESGA